VLILFLLNACQVGQICHSMDLTMKKTHTFSGVYTALATPFLNDQIDRESLDRLIEHQLKGGVHGLVAVGTTGESPTLSHPEHIEVVRATVQAAAGRVPVYAGAGSNATSEAIDLVQQAEATGVDGFLLVAPYYNKPSQEGLFQHFSAIAEVTRLPIILYSIPSRCGIEIGVETTARLYEKFPHICCMKAAEGSCEKVVDYVRTLGSDFSVLSGDDSLTLPFMSVGARGVISVASNLVPAALVKIVSDFTNGEMVAAQADFLRFFPLFKNLFIEPNPVPLKYALQQAAIISSAEVRLPLCGLQEHSRRQLDACLKSLV
jgi:4-hydroxy-tetrahydrodipicolinate synthase